MPTYYDRQAKLSWSFGTPLSFDSGRPEFDPGLMLSVICHVSAMWLTRGCYVSKMVPRADVAANVATTSAMMWQWGPRGTIQAVTRGTANDRLLKFQVVRGLDLLSTRFRLVRPAVPGSSVGWNLSQSLKIKE
nr:hypothetical protein [Tanacetum cinerariifolium]